MKKFLALLLALAMVFALAACNNTTSNNSQAPSTQSSAPSSNSEQPGSEETTPAGDVTADDIDDNMTSADGTYTLAFVTDVGQLKDKSFNEGTWNGVKLYAYQNGMSYKYYQPANGGEATDDDRYDAMKAAVDAGAEVVVAAGFMQEAALTRIASENPDINFVFIDGYPLTDGNGNVLTNVAGISFKEEQCGYFAGYAIVMDGFTKLGFSGGGGGSNDACRRYGYGYVQGAEAAAAQLGITVDMNFSWAYGASFSASPELQTMINGWYVNGTEIVFACGGAMFDSITAAAGANDGYVVGVDSDQSFQDPTVITSALKGVGEAAAWAIGKVYDGSWDEIGGTSTSLGVADGAVGLPTETWALENFTVEQYEDLFQQVLNGTLVVDNDFNNQDSAAFEHVNLNIIE